MKPAKFHLQLALGILFFIVSDVALGGGGDVEEEDEDYYADLGLTPEEVKKYKTTFDKIDQDKDGYITKEELSNILKKQNRPHTEETLDRWMYAADYNEDGVIDFDEFLLRCAVVKEAKIENEYLKMTFDDIDTDQNGLITPKELLVYLLSLGEEVSNEQVNEMIFPADVDRDGAINFYEFKRMMYIIQLIQYYEDLLRTEEDYFDSDEECEDE